MRTTLNCNCATLNIARNNDAMLRPTRRAVLGALAAAPLAASPAFAARRLDIVATTAMIADMAARIGGDRVSVASLMGPGVDPHGYRQTRADIVKLTRSDLALWNGLYLEAQMEEFFHQLAATRGRVLPLAESLLSIGDQLSGSRHSSLQDFERAVIWELRLPRTALAVLCPVTARAANC